MSTVALTSPAVPRTRRLRSVLGWTVVLAIVVVWTISLRPQFLGGPTAIVVVAGTSMQPALHTSDLVLVHRQGTYRVGDVVAYRVPDGSVGAGGVVIHRIRGGSAAEGFVMRGDNRDSDDQWRPKPADIMGKRWIDAPTSNRFFSLVRSPIGLAAFAALFTFLLIAVGARKPPPPR